MQIDECLTPDDPSLNARRKGIEREFMEAVEPPLMAGAGNKPDSIRKSYKSNLHAMQLEGLPVSESTPSFAFWEYVITLQDRYLKQLPKKNGTDQPV